jgi:hypothetical protein
MLHGCQRGIDGGPLARCRGIAELSLRICVGQGARGARCPHVFRRSALLLVVKRAGNVLPHQSGAVAAARNGEAPSLPRSDTLTVLMKSARLQAAKGERAFCHGYGKPRCSLWVASAPEVWQAGTQHVMFYNLYHNPYESAGDG